MKHSSFASLIILVSVFPFSFAFAQSTQPADTQPAWEDIRVVERTRDASGAVVARLSNGLRVVVKPHHTAPVVSVRAFVRAGGLYEGKWLGCGISHLVEHLVAKYSTTESAAGHIRTKSEESVSRLDKIGGQANAFTSLASTCYYVSAVASKATDCIDLIVEQLAEPDITLADFEREHGVVQRELEMGKDDPMRILYYMHMKNLYQDHPAGVPVIGYPGPLSRLTYDDVLAYHREMYVPQNMVLVIAGDVEPRAMLDHVAKQTRGFNQGRQPVLDLPDAPKLTGVRRVVAKSKAFQETAEFISFQTIPLLHPDLYPLDVLSTILSRGDASRLVKALQFEKRLVTYIDTWSSTPAWGLGDFAISFRTQPGRADLAEKAILEELRKVLEEGVTDEELARAKRQMTADFVRRQQTAESVAATLGSDLLTTGDPAFSENYTKNIRKVTAEEVLAVAKKYFRFDDLAVTRVVPESHQSDVTTTTKTNNVSQADVYTLPNGLRVVLQPSEEVGLAAMTLASKGGLLLETSETNGLGNLLTSLSTRGAGQRTGDEIAAFFSHAGGSIQGACGDNSLYWQASVLSDEVIPALEIFADVVLNPTFPKKELDAYRPLIEAQIRRQDEHWFSQLSKFWRAKFFAGCPWEMLPDGRLPVIQAATPEQLKAYHDRVVLAGSSVLTVFGNFDPAKVKALIARRFGDMPVGPTPPHPAKPRVVKSGGETYVKKTNTKQAGIIVAAPGTTVPDLKQRLPLMLLDTIISGYSLPSGWLHKELRGKKLVYVVHAYHKTGFMPGAFLVYAGTQPEHAKKVVDIIQANLRKAAQYTPTRDELDRAITSIVTSEILDNQTVDALSLAAALNELYGLGVDWPKTLEAKLKAVTPQQVRDVAKQLLDRGLVVTVITPNPELFPPETIVQEEKQVEKTE
ncbi:MAG: insulinase family protein [Phycisphaerae bacterium]|nr:insulinase family protein [Phycisphaerae bacterium]